MIFLHLLVSFAHLNLESKLLPLLLVLIKYPVVLRFKFLLYLNFRLSFLDFTHPYLLSLILLPHFLSISIFLLITYPFLYVLVPLFSFFSFQQYCKSCTFLFFSTPLHTLLLSPFHSMLASLCFFQNRQGFLYLQLIISILTSFALYIIWDLSKILNIAIILVTIS